MNMWKSFFVSVIIILCAALIESVILSNITILPAIPDLVMICVLYISLENGKLMGETTGFVSGLFLDFMSACPFGLNCLLRTILGYIGGLFNKTFNTDGFFIPSLLGLCTTISKALLLWFFSFLYPSSVVAYNPFTLSFLFEIIFNVVLTPFIFKLLKLFKNSLLLKPETII
jgi:rod shape-determining protein MreD